MLFGIAPPPYYITLIYISDLCSNLDGSKHLFYNACIATLCFVSGNTEGSMSKKNENEFYRKEIYNLILKCENTHWLKVIYAYIKRLLK